MTVVDLIRDQDEAKSHEVTFTLWPKLWAQYAGTQLAEFNWEIYRFGETEIQRVPDEPGVYTFVIQPSVASHPNCSYLMYVGMTERSLRQRFKEYVDEKKREKGRPKLVRLLNKYPEQVHFCCSALKSGTPLKKVEEALMAAWLPPCNDLLPTSVRRIIGGLK